MTRKTNRIEPDIIHDHLDGTPDHQPTSLKDNKGNTVHVHLDPHEDIDTAID